MGMLETVREFAFVQLQASSEEEATQRVHAIPFLSLAEAAPAHLHGAEKPVWLARLESEHAYLQVALAWRCSRISSLRCSRTGWS
jgi:hypothetical protein